MCTAKHHLPIQCPLPQSLRERRLVQVEVVQQNGSVLRRIWHEAEGWIRWRKLL